MSALWHPVSVPRNLSGRPCGRSLSEHGIEVQFDLSACALFWRVHHAGIEGPRINVQTHRSLVEFPRIYHTMHGIRRIDSARLRDVHLDGVRRLQTAVPALQILMHQVEI